MEAYMATMKDIITSPLLLIMVIIGLLYIVVFSLIYLKKAYNHCLELGITKETLKNVIKSSLVFSIVPSLSIVVGALNSSGYMVPSPMQIPSIMRNTEQGFYLVRSGKRNTDLLPEVKKACPRKFRQTPESVSGISWKMLPAMSFCGRRCFITAPTGFRKNWTNVRQCSAISYGMRIRLIF